MVRADRAVFTPDGRTRRPPRDRANALLSFCYALLRAECEAALEGVGLDPQVGYLHALRPGRPAVALDLMEELRPTIADRLVLRMVNRRQIRGDHFDETPGGAVSLNEQGRRATLAEYERRKESAGVGPILHNASGLPKVNQVPAQHSGVPAILPGVPSEVLRSRSRRCPGRSAGRR